MIKCVHGSEREQAEVSAYFTSRIGILHHHASSSVCLFLRLFCRCQPFDGAGYSYKNQPLIHLYIVVLENKTTTIPHRVDPYM